MSFHPRCEDDDKGVCSMMQREQGRSGWVTEIGWSQSTQWAGTSLVRKERWPSLSGG
ncbi:hypothetical protein OG21DRAFT_1517964 [Imleria badia]|nr:hypothetical protein OG21DRAFT_1517964 [Imleria badia]